MKKIALINGVNLDRLGRREPQIYGTTTLADITSALRAEAEKLGAQIIDFQSNHEGEIVDKIYELADSGVYAYERRLARLHCGFRNDFCGGTHLKHSKARGFQAHVADGARVRRGGCGAWGIRILGGAEIFALSRGLRAFGGLIVNAAFIGRGSSAPEIFLSA